IDHQTNRMRSDRPLLCYQAAIGEANSRSRGRRRFATEQVPWPRSWRGWSKADEAGIEKVEALGARTFDLAIRFAHEHRVSLMDREVRRTDFDFQRHPSL